MINNFVTYFGSLVLLLLALIGLMVCYFKENDYFYHFQNTFPYELAKVKTNTPMIISRILLLSSFMFLFAFYIIYPFELYLSNIDIMSKFVSIIGCASIISFFGIFLFDMKNVKLHLIMDVFLFSFSFILTASIAVMGFWTLNDQSASSIDLKKIICASVACLMAILQLILIFNPKLKDWSKLEQKSNDDGTIVYVRPKWFALAYSEWSFILSTYINGLIVLIMFI